MWSDRCSGCVVPPRPLWDICAKGKRAADGRVRPPLDLSVCFHRSGHQQGGPGCGFDGRGRPSGTLTGIREAFRPPAGWGDISDPWKRACQSGRDPETRPAFPPPVRDGAPQTGGSRHHERPAPAGGGAGAGLGLWPPAGMLHTHRVAGAMAPAGTPGRLSSLPPMQPVGLSLPLHPAGAHFARLGEFEAS